ncbi:MAG: hypothetical protein CVV60_04575, partial [Tenericutes bacterium HGW-Tenericutes-5]
MKNIRNKGNIKHLAYGFVVLFLSVLFVGCGNTTTTLEQTTLPEYTITINTTTTAIITDYKFESTIEVYGFVDSSIYVGEAYVLPEILVLEDYQVTTDYYIVLNDSTLDINTPGSYFITLEIRREGVGLLTTKVATIKVEEYEEEIDYSPKIIGAKDLIVRLYDRDIDWKEGITVIDPVYGDITGSLKIYTPSLDINQIGTYTLIYWVENANGYQDQVTIQVSVVFLEEFYQLPSEFFITKINDLYGVYDTLGNEVIPVIYNDVEYLNEGIIRLSTSEIDVYYNLFDETYLNFDKTPQKFYNGVAVFAENEKFGYISIENEIIVPAIYMAASDFLEGGYALVAISNNSYGYIDLEGEAIIDLIYTTINPLFDNAEFADQLFLVERGSEDIAIINAFGDEIIELNNLSTSKLTIGDDIYIQASTEKGNVFISQVGELLTDGESILYYYQTFNTGTDETPVYLLRDETGSKYYTVASSETLNVLETDIRDFNVFDSDCKHVYYVGMINNDIYAYDNEMHLIDYVDKDSITGYTWLGYLDVLNNDLSMITYRYRDDEMNEVRILFYLNKETLQFNQLFYHEVIVIKDVFIFTAITGTDEYNIDFVVFNEEIIETFTSGEISQIIYNDDGYKTSHVTEYGIFERFYWSWDGRRLYPDSYMGEIETYDNYIIATRFDPLDEMLDDTYQLLDLSGEIILTSDYEIVPVNSFAVMVYQKEQIDNHYLIYNVLTKEYSANYYEDAEYIAEASGYLVSSVSEGISYISLLDTDFTRIIDQDISNIMIYDNVMMSYESLSSGKPYLYLLTDNSFVLTDYDDIHFADQSHVIFSSLGDTYIYDVDQATQMLLTTNAVIKVERIDEESFAVDFSDSTSIYRIDTESWYIVSLPGNSNYIGLSDDYAVFGIGNNLIYLGFDSTLDSYIAGPLFTVVSDISVVDNVIVYDYGYYFDVGNSTLYRNGDPVSVDEAIPDEITFYDDTFFTLTDSVNGAISYYTIIDTSILFYLTIESQTIIQLAPNGNYYFNKINSSYNSVYKRTQTIISLVTFVKQESGHYAYGSNIGVQILQLDDEIMVTEYFGEYNILYFDPVDGSPHVYDTKPTGIVSLEDHRFMFGDYEIEYHDGLIYVLGDMTRPYDSLEYNSFGMLQAVYNDMYDYYLDGVLICEDAGEEVFRLSEELYYTVNENVFTVFDVTQKYLEIETTTLTLLSEEHNLFMIFDGLRYGVVDLNGNTIVESIYSEISISDNYLLVANEGIYTIYTLSGIRVLPEHFSEIEYVS